MNLSEYSFIALDLETTGLDTVHDTIIEIAAIRFQLERVGDTFRTIHMEERSMLIDPERELKEEIRMITGINEKMLRGREKWEDVRERVREFIGDAIIIGHNVLFDIAMLETHGIDLREHRALDTFELSEIFSQDAESLNLLFLAKKYGITIDGEHRALDDTRLSIGLFTHYLESICLMNELELQIFSSFIDRDRYGIIVHLLSITDLNVGDGYRFPFTSEYHGDSRIPTFPTPENTHIKCQNLSGDLDEEREIIQAALRESGKIILYTNGCTQSQFWKKTLENMQYSTAFLLTPDKFCSLDILGEYITRISFTRKELIFALKMLFWIHSTETSLLDELKYYGEERVLIDFFRSERDEYSLFREKFEASSTHADALICSSLGVSIPTGIGKYHVVIQDIYQLEDTLRREYSQRISFDQLWSDIELLGKQGIFGNTSLEDLSFGLSYFEHLITTIHTRPKGPLTSPPGAHGETYYFDQEMLWKQGGPWLTQVMRILDETVHREKIYTGNTGGIEKKIRKRCLVAIQTLIELTYIRDENCGCILTILEDAVILSLIPRNTAKYVQSSIHSRLGEKTILLQYGKGGPLMRSFLEKECGIYWNAEEKGGHSDHRMETRTDLELLVQDTSSCVILSTSNKHLRQITDEVKKYHPEAKIFTQGLSGGKGKIMSLYEQYSGKKILIGLIDSWIDDSHIWSLTDRVILAKIPFDPPTDPYYLARTVGMKNNFEEYSCPMTLSTINTLIGRISTANPQNQIFCLDDRLTNTPWGGKIWNEVL